MNKAELLENFLVAYHDGKPFISLKKFFSLQDFDDYRENRHYEWLVYQINQLNDDSADDLPGMIYGIIYTTFASNLLVDMFNQPLAISDFRWEE